MTNFTPARRGDDHTRGFFDGDLNAVSLAVGLPLHLYHACFDAGTPYAKANGGKFSFDVSPGDRDGAGAHFAQVSAEDSYAFYTMLWQGASARAGEGRFIGSEVDHQVNTQGVMDNLE